MLIRLLSLCCAAALVGCASPSAKDITAPDGTKLKKISCNRDSAGCLEAATAACIDSNGTYRVITSHSNAGGTVADILPGPVTWFHMTISCGKPDGVMPSFAFRGPQPVMPNFESPTRKTITTNCSTYGSNTTCRSR